MTTRRTHRDPAISQAWARILTDDRLAGDLERVANDIRHHDPETRAALLREAASRIRERRTP